MSNTFRPEIALSVYLNEQLLGVCPCLFRKIRNLSPRMAYHLHPTLTRPWKSPATEAVPFRCQFI